VIIKNVLLELPEDLYYRFLQLKGKKQANTWVDLVKKLVEEEGL
jgi:hypothetical protein